MAYKIKQMVLGPAGANCYVLYNTDTMEAVVIDPADSAGTIQAFIEREGLSLSAVVLTHGHFDHIGAADELRNIFGVELYGHKDEDELLANPYLNLSDSMGMVSVVLHPDKKIIDGSILHLAGFDIKVLHTPGHTRGGVCYYLESEGILFSGDTLFAGSVGRTDFPGGSSRSLIDSIREKLMVLPEDTVVYPGHGEQTTIGVERTHNPFL